MKRRLVYTLIITVLLVTFIPTQAFADLPGDNQMQTKLKERGISSEDSDFNIKFRDPHSAQNNGNVKIGSTIIKAGMRLKNGDVLDFSELGFGSVIYNPPEFSDVSDVMESSVDAKVTIKTPQSFGINVTSWVVDSVNPSVKVVYLRPKDYVSNIKIGNKDVKAWSMVTFFDTISFGNNKGTIAYYEDGDAKIPMKKVEGSKKYKVGFGNFEDHKVIAWAVIKVDPFHNLVELCPYGLGGTHYTLLDKGHEPLLYDRLYIGLCIEVGAAIEVYTDILNHLDISYLLPGDCRSDLRIEGSIINLPSPSSEYDNIRYWKIVYIADGGNSITVQPVYDTKPYFDYYFPVDGGTKDNPWQVGEYSEINAYIEDGTLFLEGEGKIKDYYFEYAPWYDTTYIIKNIVIGEGITEVGIEAFRNLKSVESITLPSTLTTIDKGAFRGLSGISYVELPSNINCLKYDAFSECYNLKQVKIGIGLKTVMFAAFGNTSLEKVEYEGTEAAWNQIEIDLSDGYNDKLVNAEITFGNKSSMTASIIAGNGFMSLNTLIILITCLIVSICAIICTRAYARKQNNK